MQIISSWKQSRSKRLRRKFDLLSNCLREFTQRTCFRNRAISREICKEYGLGVVGKLGQGLEIGVWVPVSLHGPAHVYLPDICFSIPMWIWNPRPVAPTSSFVFSCRWYLWWGLRPYWWLPQLSWVSLMCKCYSASGWFFSCSSFSSQFNS